MRTRPRSHRRLATAAVVATALLAACASPAVPAERAGGSTDSADSAHRHTQLLADPGDRHNEVLSHEIVEIDGVEIDCVRVTAWYDGGLDCDFAGELDDRAVTR